MATMTTSLHGMSVLTNSSVKLPINPVNGLSTTLPEIPVTYIQLEDDERFTQPENDIARMHETDTDWSLTQVTGLGFPKTKAYMGISHQLSNLNDDAFYEQLTALKREHNKTLSICEKLYREKVDSEHSAHISKQVISDDHDVEPVSNSVENLFHPDVNNKPNFETHTPIKDRICDLSSKPPTGRSQQMGFHRSYSPPMIPNSTPMYRQRSLYRSLDEEVWKKNSLQNVLDDSDLDQDIPFETLPCERNVSQDVPSSVACIEDMWENFSVDDYAPRSGRPSSAVVTKKEKKQKVKEWRYKLTIPKPFNMTIREASKEKKKTQAMIELDNKKIRKEQQDEVECQKKFKAKPAPAHIYFPLYDEIMEKNETRRRNAKQYSGALLKAQEKPFKFSKREDEKQKHRKNYSAPQTDVTVRKCTSFKAKPIPKYIFNNSINEKIQEEELYRKIRMKMRSEELLRSAELPPNMEARQRFKEQKTNETAMKSRKKDFKPKINHDIPDYDKMYKNFQKELSQRKQKKEVTVMEPFTLQTSRVPSNRDKMLKDMETDELLKESRWPYRSTREIPSKNIGHLSSSLDSIPTKSSGASVLRSTMNRGRIHALTKKEHDELETSRKQRIKNIKLRIYVSDRAGMNDSLSSAREQKEKLRKFRVSNINRQEEYQRELAGIKDRINKRPLLFEQESQINVKKAAERKFSATLRNCGLDEDFIHSRSSRTGSMTAGEDSYDDDFEDTCLKTRYDDNERSLEDD